MTLKRAAQLVALLALSTLPAVAQDTTTTTTPGAAPAAGELVFQLNKAETSQGACTLTFVLQNNTGTVIDKSVYNMAIVNKDGVVATLINIEFKSLPVGRPKVQGFGIPNLACEDISAISINDFTECTAADGTASTVCEDEIAQSSRTSIQFPWAL